MKLSAKKWLFTGLALVIAFIMILSLTVYIIDPFFQFRVKDNSYMLNGQFVSPGLIKNYDYDTFILGSSMTQNFDMNVFRQELGVKPLHIGIGGIRASEEKALLDLAYETGRAKNYYICAEMHLFTADSEESRIPEYLIEDDLLSRMRYFLNYEAWFRYMPVDVGFMTLDKIGISQPQKFQYSKSIDRLEDWRLDFEFGEEIVLANRKSGEYNVSNVDMTDIYNRMTKRIDEYFDGLQLDKGEHTFFFAPYSMLYWAERTDELVDALLYGKRYFIEKAWERGITVYDFQTADFTTDLNNYKDVTHYTPEINDWMTKCFATGEYIVTSQNYGEHEAKLVSMRAEFRETHSELFR